MIKLIDKLEKSFGFWFLTIASPIFFLLRLPSLFEPYWYGDEGIYHVLGSGIRNGRLLYEGVWDNKPPLLYFTYALAGADQFYIRLLSAIFGVLSLIAFYFLCKLLFEGKKSSKHAAYATALFGILFATPVVEGNIANAENLMLLPIILAGIVILREVKTKGHLLQPFLGFLAGLLLGISFLFKIVAIFDIAAFSFFIFLVSIDNFRKNGLEKVFLRFARTISPLYLGIITPIGLFCLLFLLQGNFKDFVSASFTKNVGYVGYYNKLLVPQGLLIAKILILIFLLSLIYLRRARLSISYVFISAWFLLSLFNAFFSQRPYTHYLLVLLPSFSLMFGFFLNSKKVSSILTILFLASLLLIAINFKFYNKTFIYYQNFYSFAIGQKPIFDYRSFFDRNTPYDYAIANYIKSHTSSSDQIFIWGNNAQVYALSGKLPPGKYTVAYHINTSEALDETRKNIKKSSPKLIILMDNVGSYPFSLSGYAEKMRIDKAMIYEKII